jgi:hypothetical protein
MITYDELKRIARDVRAELALSGKLDFPKGKIRKKPRAAEKTALLYVMALNRLEKYPPRRDAKGNIVFPYFTSARTP